MLHTSRFKKAPHSLYLRLILLPSPAYPLILLFPLPPDPSAEDVAAFYIQEAAGHDGEAVEGEEGEEKEGGEHREDKEGGGCGSEEEELDEPGSEREWQDEGYEDDCGMDDVSPLGAEDVNPPLAHDISRKTMAATPVSLADPAPPNPSSRQGERVVEVACPPTPVPKVRVRRGGNTAVQRKAKTRRPNRIEWTQEEEEAVRRGVASCGQGKWVDIRRKFAGVFNVNDRSTVDIKDKWRTLKRQTGGHSTTPKRKRAASSLSAQEPAWKRVANAIVSRLFGS